MSPPVRRRPRSAPTRNACGRDRSPGHVSLGPGGCSGVPMIAAPPTWTLSTIQCFCRAAPMHETDTQHLRVLIANEKRDRLELLAQVVIGLGHDVIVREASCPVIAILHADDPAYVHEAAKRGVFAYIIDGTPEELQSSIDITLQRFSEYQSLQGAFGRRALIEQAKGILMARHSINAELAFERLRDHSQHNGRKLADVAAAVVESHLLLVPTPTPSARPD